MYNKTMLNQLSYELPTPVSGIGLPRILVISTYPPRVCGIATYSKDLVTALSNKFNSSFTVSVCALETDHQENDYPDEVHYVLNTSRQESYLELAESINEDPDIKVVLLQHEFGFFDAIHEESLLLFLYAVTKPVSVVFHTVLPQPDSAVKEKVNSITDACESVIVMTRNAARILYDDYGTLYNKITIIAHGTHLVKHIDNVLLKEKYGLQGRKVLSTFGLLGSGKGIETTLDALPGIIAEHSDVLFLIIGKTHPGVIRAEGERYRDSLEAKVDALKIRDHVLFINSYLNLEPLLEYLQLTDIYLFTSRDPNQAVSGTFSYAMSCGCPIISTPIPHAREMLRGDAGIIIDFQNSGQLAEQVNRLLNDELLRKTISLKGLQKITSTVWENSAIAHAGLFNKISGNKILLDYKLPGIKLDHLERMTTDFGILQFSRINQPDYDSGYTLDDNARALIALCMHYELTGDVTNIENLEKYFNFIKYCLQPGGNFLNYVDRHGHFSKQNNETNLEDANGRAVWALGYLISRKDLLPAALVRNAEITLRQTLSYLGSLRSPRAISFAIKGLYYYNSRHNSPEIVQLISTLSAKLAVLYHAVSTGNWEWFENSLTYANSSLPEAMLYAWLTTKDPAFKDIAVKTFDFLLSHTFTANDIKVISNRSWLHKDQPVHPFGEQPIDVAYTIGSLHIFYETFKDEDYLHKIKIAFNWFLGKNHLQQVVYNPVTGGCYDGLEEFHVNINQGAESAVCYLIARLIVEKHVSNTIQAINHVHCLLEV
jgi:glycosyltransferase involved in cell wall biosynthesis/uncharacterized membrane protein